MISLVSSASVEQLSGGSAENMTFTGFQNISRTLNLPSTMRFITSGTITLDEPDRFQDLLNTYSYATIGHTVEGIFMEDGQTTTVWEVGRDFIGSDSAVFNTTLSSGSKSHLGSPPCNSGGSDECSGISVNGSGVFVVYDGGAGSSFIQEIDRLTGVPVANHTLGVMTNDARDVALCEDGRFYVVEQDTLKVHIFDSSYSHVTSWDADFNSNSITDMACFGGRLFLSDIAGGGQEYLEYTYNGTFIRNYNTSNSDLFISSSWEMIAMNDERFISGNGNGHDFNEFRGFSAFPNNPYLETGTPDGTREFFAGGHLIDNVTQINFTATQLQTINDWISGNCGASCNVPFLFHSDDSGFLRYSLVNFSNTGFIENSQTFNSPVLEQTPQEFSINISYDNATYTSITGTLVYNNTEYSGINTGSGTNALFTTDLTTPNIDSTQNISFWWRIEMSGSESFSGNSTFQNQTVTAVEFDDCSVHPFLIYNFTVRDEDDRSILVGGSDNVTTEVEVKLSALGDLDPFLTFSQTFSATNPATVCSSVEVNDTFRTDIVASYISLDHAQEFYFVDNGTISNNTAPQHIDLHDLLLTESTTFLFNFLDENGLDPENAMIHTERKYIGDGVFREVERSKEDDNGETHVHLVQEDVIYRFRVTQNSNELFLSSEFNAKCLSTPCEITLSAEEDVTEYTGDYDNLPEGTFGISVNKLSRQVTLTFNLNQSRTMNLTVFEFNNLVDDDAVVSNTLTAFSGSVAVTVPQSFGNTTFYAIVYKDDEFVDSVWIDLTPEAKDWFPNGLGLILTAILVLVLALMGAGSGVMIIIMTIIALIVASLIFLLDMDMVALMGIIVAGGIIVWKLVSGRRNS
jgi:hypothetical protein